MEDSVTVRLRRTSHFHLEHTTFGLSSINGHEGGYDGVEQPISRYEGHRFFDPNSSQRLQLYI
jgi:hypothetical protein